MLSNDILFQIRSDEDLTGTYIRSNFPIAVFAGNEFTAIGVDRMGDHLVEQMIPITAWGTEYIMMSVGLLVGSDLIRLIGQYV